MKLLINKLKIACALTLILIVSTLGFGSVVSASSSVENDFMTMLNTERTGLGEKPLATNTSLSTAAYLHSKDMAENNYFSHTSLDGTTFDRRIVNAGYTNYYSLGENIAEAYGSPDAATVFGMWKNSPGHYANMIGDFTDAGLGVYTQNGYTFYTLDLGGRTYVPPPTADFSISVSPATQTIVAGSPGNYSINIIPSNGFSGLVNFSVTGLPNGTNGSFTPNPTTNYSTLNISTLTSISPGTYVLNVIGSSGSLARTTTATLIIGTVSPPTADFSIGILPPTQTIAAGSSCNFNINLMPINGFSLPVNLVVSGLPNGATGSFTPNPMTNTSILNVTSSKSVLPGTYSLILTGTSGNMMRTTTATLVITNTIDGVAAKLAFIVTPSVATAGLPFTIQPSVTIQDTNGNIVTSSTAPITLSVTIGTGVNGAVLSGNKVLNASNGTAAFNGLSINLAGTNYSLTATSGTLTSAVSNPFNVVDGTGSDLAITTPSTLPSGWVGVPYSTTITASGGSPPFVWSVQSGIIPIGLSLNPSTGTLTGTPTSATSAIIFTIKVADIKGNSIAKSFSMGISSGPAITTVALSNGMPNVAYNQSLTALGGYMPYTWSIASGALPVGLYLNASNGLISGIAPFIGSSSVVFKVSDRYGRNSLKTLSIDIISGPSITSPPNLAFGEIGVPYSQTLVASGGSRPYSWSIQSGFLPLGLSLNSADGTISGTPGKASMPVTITIKVQDSTGTTSSKDFSITIISNPTITTSLPLPNGQITIPYSQLLSVSGGLQPYTWSIQSGSLPSGLTINQVSGAITGTPTAPTNSTFAIGVTDSLGGNTSKIFSITVLSPGLVVNTDSLPFGETGIPYFSSLSASGGTAPYTWVIQSGSLPPGLSLNPANGSISGIPNTAANPVSITFKVIDYSGNSEVATLSIVILTNPVISTVSPLGEGNVGIPYAQTLVASGGMTPYNWSIQSGTLPAGLSLSTTTGVISGTPSAMSGSFSITIKVTDIFGGTSNKDLSITISAVVANLTIATSSNLTEGRVGAPYSTILTASGGTPPYVWSVQSGTMPIGLSLDTTTGALTGTPTSPTSTITFSLKLTDARGAFVSKVFSMAILSGPAITTQYLQNGTVNFTYSQALTAAGGTPPYIWSIQSGTLPSGLMLNSTSGIISGIPTVNTGPNVIVFKVTDRTGRTNTKALSITIAPSQ